MVNAELEIFRPGCKVIVGGNIPAVVVSIRITSCMRVTYEVGWWDGRLAKREWLEEFEVKRDLDQEPDPVRIGFVAR